MSFHTYVDFVVRGFCHMRDFQNTDLKLVLGDHFIVDRELHLYEESREKVTGNSCLVLGTVMDSAALPDYIVRHNKSAARSGVLVL